MTLYPVPLTNATPALRPDVTCPPPLIGGVVVGKPCRVGLESELCQFLKPCIPQADRQPSSTPGAIVNLDIRRSPIPYGNAVLPEFRNVQEHAVFIGQVACQKLATPGAVRCVAELIHDRSSIPGRRSRPARYPSLSSQQAQHEYGDTRNHEADRQEAQDGMARTSGGYHRYADQQGDEAQGRVPPDGTSISSKPKAAAVTILTHASYSNASSRDGPAIWTCRLSARHPLGVLGTALLTFNICSACADFHAAALTSLLVSAALAASNAVMTVRPLSLST